MDILYSIKIQNDMTDEEKIMEEKAAEDKRKEEQLTLEKRLEEMHNFYTLKKGKSGEVEVALNILGICSVLQKMGYFRYDLPNGAHEYVHIQDNKIEIVTEKIITDAFEDYVRELPDYDKVCIVGDHTLELHVTPMHILNKLYQCLANYFSKNLERLRPVDKYGRPTTIKILHDTADTKYVYFRNCVVAAKKDGVEIIDYPDIKDGYIMANSIIDRDWVDWMDSKDGDFERFCKLISHLENDRLEALMSILGYLMHDYYDVDLRAAYFTDVNMDNSKHAAGGTGKGILGFALANILNRSPREDVKYIAVPGKGFKPEDPKRYSAGDITTQLIHIQDLDNRFKFDELYNDITDGATFQKHYQNPTYRRVKIMLSMNQALALAGSSDKRRVVIYELANFFSDKQRPEVYFKHRFFEKTWGDKQWHLFDQFMVKCCITYLRYGIIEPKVINLDHRAIIDKVGQDLVAYLETGVERFGDLDGSRRQISKSQLYYDFSAKYPGQFLNQRTFTEACMNYLELSKIPSAVTRDGTDWFILYPNQEDYSKRNLQKVYL